MLRCGYFVFVVALLCGSATARADEVVVGGEPTSDVPRASGSITGAVRHRTGHMPLPDVEVVLTAPGQPNRVTRTNTSGIYRFEGLDPARYTLRVLAGKSEHTKMIDVGKLQKMRVNFGMVPELAEKRTVVVQPVVVKLEPDRTYSPHDDAAEDRCADRAARRKAQRKARAARRQARRDRNASGDA